MEGDVAGVRIIPPLVEFKDTEVNTPQQVNITVKNVSKSSKSIRYYGPQSKVSLGWVTFRITHHIFCGACLGFFQI